MVPPTPSERGNTRAQSATFRLGYSAPLDGLRGLSILTVLAVHALVPNIRANSIGGAFVGVDVFFVLSGFLITSQLVEEWDSRGHVSLKAFYMRRALRLLPCLLLMLGVVVVVAFLTMPATRAMNVLKDSLFPLLYVSNWGRALGYDRPQLFAHTWSLSIEEQFYFLWPVILILLLRRDSSRSFLIYSLVLALFVASIWRVLLVAKGAAFERVFNGTDTRCDALLVGCLVAALLRGRSGRENPRCRSFMGPLAWFSLALLAALSFREDFHKAYVQTMLYPLVSACAAIIIFVVIISKNSLLSKALSQTWLVFLGKISYGLYLWHVPILSLAHQEGSPFGLRQLIAVFLSVAAAIASYFLLEQRVLRLKRRFTPLLAHLPVIDHEAPLNSPGRPAARAS